MSVLERLHFITRNVVAYIVGLSCCSCEISRKFPVPSPVGWGQHRVETQSAGSCVYEDTFLSFRTLLFGHLVQLLSLDV